MAGTSVDLLDLAAVRAALLPPRGARRTAALLLSTYEDPIVLRLLGTEIGTLMAVSVPGRGRVLAARLVQSGPARPRTWETEGGVDLAFAARGALRLVFAGRVKEYVLALLVADGRVTLDLREGFAPVLPATPRRGAPIDLREGFAQALPATPRRGAPIDLRGGFAPALPAYNPSRGLNA